MDQNLENKPEHNYKPVSIVKYRPLILGLIIGALFMVFAFKSSTLTSVLGNLADIQLIHYFVGVATYGGYLVLRALRWHLLLADVSKNLPFSVLFRATVWGTAANSLIPHSGEVLRSFAVRKDLDTTASKVLGTIATERIFDFITVIILTASILVTYSENPNVLVSALITLSLMGSVVVVAALVICARSRYIRAIFNVLSRVLPRLASEKLLWQFEQLAFGIQQSLKAPKLHFIIGLSFLQWMAIATCIYTSMLSVGITPSYWVALIVLPLTIAGLTLPTAPGYLGTIQVAFLIALEGIGFSEEKVLASSFVYLGTISLPVITISLIWYIATLLQNQQNDLNNESTGE